jgi:putative restriction endonuclease
MIEPERERRKEMWDQLIAQGGPKDVSPNLIRKLEIYGGAQGIWVDKARTELLTNDGYGVTVGLLHTGEYYPDDLSNSGVVYHYPKTNRPPSRDFGEIQATKAVGNLLLPVFVITLPNPGSKFRNVHLGWVEGWDDEKEVFYVSFLGEKPAGLLDQPEDNVPFLLQEEISEQLVMTKARPGQQRFSFLVFQSYGEKCAVCDIDLVEVLDAAHIRPKKFHGSDDPRNGLVLCTLHHRALDAGLFCINPDTLELCYRDEGPDANKLRITRNSLSHLRSLPHYDALWWLYDTWTELHA